MHAVGSQLPDAIRSLFVEEMQFITEGTPNFKGMEAANHDLVARQAQDTHDNFSMVQKITDVSKKETKKFTADGFY